MSKFNWGKRAYAVCLLSAATAIALPAQTVTTLHSFDGTDGAFPSAALVQATDGNLYGTASSGGGNDSACNFYGCGTIFKITPSGTLTTLYSFCSQSGCTDGDYPFAGLVQARNGNFYGTTVQGGDFNWCYFGCGTVFTFTPSGALTTLYTFCSQIGCTDGATPLSALAQASDGNLYGTTTGGGLSSSGGGTIFKITRSGTLTTIYSFCSQSGCTDGSYPQGSLVQAKDGNFYGTTYYGGANSGGTVFKITPSGTLTTLYSFCSLSGCRDGANPFAGLVQGSDGNLYGTTQVSGTIQAGTVFKITPGGRLTTLYVFCSQVHCADGKYLEAGLVQATDGNLYGTTYLGGVEGGGSVFRITTSGALTMLYSFCSQSGCADGKFPAAALVQDTDGNLYGTTNQSGPPYQEGTVFSLSVGLGPFVQAQPTFGKVGRVIKILGTSLTGATSVTFNGTPAAFAVKAASLIKATVPAGATTGTVQVVTPSGTLSSNVPFRVVP